MKLNTRLDHIMKWCRFLFTDFTNFYFFKFVLDGRICHLLMTLISVLFSLGEMRHAFLKTQVFVVENSHLLQSLLLGITIQESSIQIM